MSFRIGLAQCTHPAGGDVLGLVDEWMSRAKSEGADLLAFPESLMTPYELAARDFAEASEPLDGPFCTGVNALAAKHGLWTIYTANERGASKGTRGTSDGLPYNTAVIVDDTGEVRSAYRKVHLFDTDFTRESDKVAAGGALPSIVAAPFGRVCAAICYDLRFPELARTAAFSACDVLVYVSAWVDGPRKVEQWKTLLRARAIENEMFVAGLSRCDRAFGAQRRDYAGNSCVFSPSGDEIAAAGLGESLVVADIDLGNVAAVRAAMPVLDHVRHDLYG